MRTQEELIKIYRNSQKTDFLGFAAEVILPYLHFEQAKEFLLPEATGEGWETQPFSEKDVLNDMREYMKFAWGKVSNHRGISASRSVQKMSAWLLILGDDELAAEIEKDENYPQYGAPALKLVCEKYGFPIPGGEEMENMCAGRPCCDYCEEGCG